MAGQTRFFLALSVTIVVSLIGISVVAARAGVGTTAEGLRANARVLPDPAPAPAPGLAPDPRKAPPATIAPAPVRAGDPIPVPLPVRAGGTKALPVPVPSGPPGASNTGVPAGTPLRVLTSDLTIGVPGTVIDGMDIRGLVRIQAANVTIRNSIIRGRALTSDGPLINALAGSANLRVIDTELFAQTPTWFAMGIYGHDFTLTRVNIHGVIDAVNLTGGNVVIEKSWLHDNLHYTKDPRHGGSPSHDDSIQIQKGSNIRIDGNTITDAHSAALQITQDSGRVSNVTFTNNYANNGACTINIAQKAYGPPQGVVITDNTFGRGSRFANCAVFAEATTRIQLARNYYVPDNTVVTVRESKG